MRDKTLLYNTLNKSLLMVDRSLARSQIEDPASFSESELETLYEFECFVNDDYDDNEAARQRLAGHWDKEKTVEFIIHVTNRCNCQCVYCYEAGIYGKPIMFDSLAILDSFLCECKLSSLYENASLSFHGGEPSLYPDIVVALYKVVNKFYPRTQSTMVSNGVLLHTPKVLQALQEVNLKKVLITIDGHRDIHDKRRPSKTRESSFDNIMLSLEALMEASIPIHISTNIDKANYREIDYVYEEIIKKYAPNDFYIAKVCSGEQNHYADCLSDSEFDEIITDFYTRHGLISNGCNDLYEEYFGTFICSSKSRHVLIIDSFGDVYSCISLTGDKRYTMGNIKDGFNLIKMRMEAYMSDVFSSSCGTCMYLPMCYGGCQLGKLTMEDSQGCPKKRFDKILPRVLEWKLIKQLNSSPYIKTTE